MSLGVKAALHLPKRGAREEHTQLCYLAGCDFVFDRAHHQLEGSLHRLENGVTHEAIADDHIGMIMNKIFTFSESDKIEG